MKIQKSNQIINPFGGINFVVDKIRKSGILSLIDSSLGTRPPQSKYSYSDLILSLWGTFFCGGDCAEDLNEHLNGYFKGIPGMKAANADTILLALKGIKTKKEKISSDKGNEYEINRHDTLNQLNLSILKHIGLLKEGQSYDFDYDNEVLKTEKWDTKKTYKMVNGYFPGMATISGMPVYFENRDGNMNVKFKQEEVLERAYKMLQDNGFNINRSRMDCGSYSENIVHVVEKYSKFFYIRARKCANLEEQIRQIKTWEQVEINYIKYEVCSIEYQPFNKKMKSYRLVVMRRDTGEKQLNLFTGDSMEYRCILTNDRESREKEIIEYYNQRGAEERTIDALNNDFGWKHMPFSFMEENTVFLMAMMICKNVYTWLIAKFAQAFNMVKANFRMKKFIFKFITVPTKWIKRGRQQILKVYSPKSYDLLLT